MSSGDSVPDSELNFDFIPHHMRVELLAAYRRQRAKLDAREQRLLHAMATDPLPTNSGDGQEAQDKQWVREDVACALRIPPATAAGKLAGATELVTRLPQTLALLDRGEISAQHARRLTDAIRPLPAATARAVEARVLPRAVQQTPAQFALSVRRAVAALDPRGAQDQARDARQQQRIVFTPQAHGVTEIWGLLPAEGAAALQHRLQTIAEQTADPDDGRGADQRRVDALLSLALGTSGTTTSAEAGLGVVAGLRPAVQVTVALSTLLAVDEQPGELTGHGPIPAALARALACDPTGTWRRLVTDPVGAVLDTSRTYRPATELAREVRLTHRTCTFPGCRRAAQSCDLDHITAWAAGGHTTAGNLHPLCRRHHRLKHRAGWHPTPGPDGATTWRSPTGHRYTQPPDDPLPRDTTTDPPPSF